MKFERNRNPQRWKRSLLLACLVGGWVVGAKAQDPPAADEPPPFIAAPKPPQAPAIAAKPSSAAGMKGSKTTVNSKPIPHQPIQPQRRQTAQASRAPGNAAPLNSATPAPLKTSTRYKIRTLPIARLPRSR